MRASLLNRKLHRWGAVLTALPLCLILATGILLQFKKEVSWIQPSTWKGTGTLPALSFQRILDIVRTTPEAGLREWADIDRLDVRPGKGLLKVRGKNRWEVQIDARNGSVLQVAYRRSDLIESLHDGTFFHSGVKLWVFFPVALVLAGLWITGLILWILPHLHRQRKRGLSPPGERATA